MKTAASFIILILALSSCSLFEKRDAAAPTSAANRDFTNYQDFIDAIIDIYSTPGKSNDLALLFDDTLFVFSCDSSDASDLPTVPKQWGAAKEKLVTSAMLSDSKNIVAAFATSGVNKPVPQSPSLDSVIVRWAYLFQRNDQELFSGTCEFTLIRRQNRFYLHAWKDIRDAVSANKSWGRWKMENY